MMQLLDNPADTILRSREAALDRIARCRDALMSLDFHGDFGDRTGAFTDRSRLVSEIVAAHEQIEQLDAALGQLARGLYGLCEDCGQPVPSARLLAVPLAKRCLACQTQVEQRAATPRMEVP